MEYLLSIAPIPACAYRLPLEVQQENKRGGNYSSLVRISCAVCKVVLPRVFSGHYSMLSLPLRGSALVGVDSITTNLMDCQGESRVIRIPWVTREVDN